MRTPQEIPKSSERFRMIEDMLWEPVKNIGTTDIPPFAPFVVVNLTDGTEGAGKLTMILAPTEPVATVSENEVSRAVGFAGPAGVAAGEFGVGNFQAPYIGRATGSWETSGSMDEEDVTPRVFYLTSQSTYLTTTRDGYVYARFWPIGEVRDVGGSLHDLLVIGNPIANVETSETGTGSCGCEVANGVVEPITSPPFYWKAAMQWKEPSRVVAWLNTISGFESLTYSDLYLTWNGNGAWNSPVFIRTCGSVSDSYMATAQQVAGGWRWTFSAVGTVNCSDQVKLVLKSKKTIPYEDRTNWLVIDTDLTPKRGTAGYAAGPPDDCLFCWSPLGVIETVTGSENGCTFTVPRYLELQLPELTLISGSAYFRLTHRDYSGDLFRILSTDFLAPFNAAFLPRSILLEGTVGSTGDNYPLVIYTMLEEEVNWGAVTFANAERETSPGSGAFAAFGNLTCQGAAGYSAYGTNWIRVVACCNGGWGLTVSGSPGVFDVYPADVGTPVGQAPFIPAQSAGCFPVPFPAGTGYSASAMAKYITTAAAPWAGNGNVWNDTDWVEFPVDSNFYLNSNFGTGVTYYFAEAVKVRGV